MCLFFLVPRPYTIASVILCIHARTHARPFTYTHASHAPTSPPSSRRPRPNLIRAPTLAIVRRTTLTACLSRPPRLTHTARALHTWPSVHDRTHARTLRTLVSAPSDAISRCMQERVEARLVGRLELVSLLQTLRGETEHGRSLVYVACFVYRTCDFYSIPYWYKVAQAFATSKKYKKRGSACAALLSLLHLARADHIVDL